MTNLYRLTLLLGCLLLVACVQQKNPLYGTWKPQTYVVGGKEYQLSGLMIIRPGYMSANTIFRLEEKSPGDANANAGSFELKGNTIIIDQWMQLHWRPLHADDSKQHFLAQNVPEEVRYEIVGNRLIFSFPSGNQYISERLTD